MWHRESRLLISKWSMSIMSIKPTQGKARKPRQPWTGVGGGHWLFRWRLRSAKAQAPAGWHLPRPSQGPHPAALSALSLTTVWPTRAGFGSRTPGTLRQEAYPEPRVGSQPLTTPINILLEAGLTATTQFLPLVGNRTAGLFPQEIQHNQAGGAKIMKCAYELTLCPYSLFLTFLLSIFGNWSPKVKKRLWGWKS